MKTAWPIDWKLAAKNLSRNKRRSIVTGLAIACGFTGMVLLSAYINRAQKGLEMSTVYANHKGHFAVMKPDSLDFFHTKPRRYLIPKEELEKILAFFKADPRVDFTAGYLTGMGLIQQGVKSTPFIALGVDPVSYQRVYQNENLLKWAKDWIESKEPTDYGEFIRNPRAVSVTEIMGTLIGRKPPFSNLQGEEKDVQLIAQNFYNDLNAVTAELGPVHTTGIALAEDTSLVAPLPLLQELYATDGVEYVAVFLKDGRDLQDVRQDFAAYLQSEGLKLDLISFSNEKWSPFYVGTLNFLYVMGAFFILLICGTVALSIVNSTAMGILERSREIGTLRALGFEPAFIRRLFIKESAVLSVLSVIAGLAAAFAIAAVVNASGIRFHPPGTQNAIRFMLILDARICFSIAILLIAINTFTAWLTTRGRLTKKIVHLLGDSGA